MIVLTNLQDLEALFRPYKVVSNRILRDSNNISRGVGFARMADRESAEAIIKRFDTLIDDEGSRLSLQVRFADSHSQKRLKSQTQRRRQWRAREYNILTGNTNVEEGFLLESYPSPSPYMTLSTQMYEGLGSTIPYADSTVHEIVPTSPANNSLAARPRSMQSSVQNGSLAMEKVVEEDIALTLSRKLETKMKVKENA